MTLTTAESRDKIQSCMNQISEKSHLDFVLWRQKSGNKKANKETTLLTVIIILY